jgi:hypothetical protein
MAAGLGCSAGSVYTVEVFSVVDQVQYNLVVVMAGAVEPDGQFRGQQRRSVQFSDLMCTMDVEDSKDSEII